MLVFNKKYYVPFKIPVLSLKGHVILKSIRLSQTDIWSLTISSFIQGLPSGLNDRNEIAKRKRVVFQWLSTVVLFEVYSGLGIVV